jgi:cell division protein ZapA
MALVDVQVNGRAYAVACDDGEEDHLRTLGVYLDRRVRELGAAAGQPSEARLLLMTGLVMADELTDALARLGRSEEEIASLRTALNAAEAQARNAESRAADALEGAASRVEAIAARLARP